MAELGNPDEEPSLATSTSICLLLRPDGERSDPLVVSVSESWVYSVSAKVHDRLTGQAARVLCWVFMLAPDMGCGSVCATCRSNLHVMRGALVGVLLAKLFVCHRSIPVPCACGPWPCVPWPCVPPVPCTWLLTPSSVRMSAPWA